jgi:PRTRC genetic system protein E
MFAELMPLLRKRRLLLTISLVEGDTIRATVVPQKASETEDNVLTTPLAITGTAEELDRDLPQQLVEFTGRTCSFKPPWPLPRPKWVQLQSGA